MILIILGTALPLPHPMGMEWVLASSLHHVSLCSQVTGSKGRGTTEKLLSDLPL